MDEANTDGTCHPSVAPPTSPLGDQFQHQQQQGDHRSHAPSVDGNTASDATYKVSDIADRFLQVVDGKTQVDSVKGAATKFGGGLDWREKRKIIQGELDKVHVEVAECQKRMQEAEAGKVDVLRELGSMASANDELSLSLEKAEAEEAHARQDAELADLRLRETQQGVSESTAAKAELDVAKDRHATALAELQAAREELEVLRKKHAAATATADAAAARARGAASSSEEAGNEVEELTAELAALKKEVKSAHRAHAEAEGDRMRSVMALEQDKVQWQDVVELSEQEAAKLEESLMATRDLESKVAAASDLLVSLRAELFAHAVEGSLGEEAAKEEVEEEKPTVSSRAMLDKVKKELDDVKASLEKAKDEAKCLRVAAASLNADLDKEKAELAALRRKEEVSSASIPSLAEELSQVTSALAEAEEAKAKDGDEETTASTQLGDARREAEQAKAKAQAAREDVAKAREEAAIAKAAVHAMETRLEAVAREILAATTSQEVAAASVEALLQKPKPPRNAPQISQDADGSVTLTLEEFDELSRRARETEESAGKRVTEAVKLIKEAKDAEVRSIEKLAQLAKQTELRHQALEAATEEAEESEFGKLTMERELRQWRAEHEHQRRLAAGETTASPRAGLAEISVFDDASGGNPHILSPRGGYMPRADMAGSASGELDADGRQKKTFFPRMAMFLARKRATNWK